MYSSESVTRRQTMMSSRLVADVVKYTQRQKKEFVSELTFFPSGEQRWKQGLRRADQLSGMLCNVHTWVRHTHTVPQLW